jgi:DNA gyrase subunit B
LVKIIERRGLDFAEFIYRWTVRGRLPQYRVVVDGRDHLFDDLNEMNQFLAEQEVVVEDEEMGKVQKGGKTAAATNGAAAGATAEKPAANGSTNGSANGNGKLDPSARRLQKNQEMHEVKELEKLFRHLQQFGLTIDDYYLTQEESVSGEKLATKHALVNDNEQHDVAGVAQIVPEIHRMVKKGGGLEIKRFKGLGEMNSEQLWETTLDPSARTLLRVTLHEAAEAERMFSVLMGEDVERRRQFIEDHALEVKNLDV